MNEAINRTAVERQIEIPAASNGVPGSKSLDAPGTSFYMIECSGEVEIRTDENPFKTYRKSTGEEFPREQSFSRLEFRNNGSARLSIRVWAGWGRYIDQRFEMLEVATRARGWTDWPGTAQQVPANSKIDVVAELGDGIISRKSVLVTNLDANENVRIEDGQGNTFLTVFPQTSITVPVSDKIAVANDTGAALSINIGEILYVENNLVTTA